MIAASATEPSGARAPSPPPARVPDNQWTRISPPDVGELRGQVALSVVLCGAHTAGSPALTLAALSEQTYPASLIEVVVAGDRDDSGELQDALGAARLTMVRPADGAADDRALADAAGGEVVLFLAAEALPVRAFLEAHARWHHAVSDAVSIGIVEPGDPGDADPARLREAARADALGDVVSMRGDHPGRGALQAYLESTGDLTAPVPGLFRVAAQRNVALRAETYRAAGALRDVGDPELARLDLAYRLHAFGAVFAPEREAVAYGSETGDGLAVPAPPAPAAGAAAGAPGERVDPRLVELIPVPGFRPRRPGRIHRRPALVVNVAVGDRGADEALEAVDAVLSGRFTDLEVRLQVPEGSQDRQALEEALADEPRASVAAGAGVCESPHQVTMPLEAVPDERTFERVHAMVWEKGIGALRLRVPRRAGRGGRVAGALGRGTTLEVVATGPLARARRIASHYGGEERAILRDLFGERRIGGSGVRVGRRGAREGTGRDEGDIAPEADLARERAEHLRHRARAATNQARADRQAQRVVRERMKARQETARADRLQAQLARVSPRHLVVWRSRRAGRRVGAVGRRAAARASDRSGRWLLRARQGRSLLRSRLRRSGRAQASG